MRNLKNVETKFKHGVEDKQYEKDLKYYYANRHKGKIPPYLQKFRQEEAEENERTKKEIAMNKRPTGTRVVEKDEQNKVLDELNG